MDEWIDITTIGQLGKYKVELEIYTNKTRHKERQGAGWWGPWVNGEPKEEDYSSTYKGK